MPAFAGFLFLKLNGLSGRLTHGGMKIAQFFIEHNFLNTQRVGWRR
jgi:hypothetical protein